MSDDCVEVICKVCKAKYFLWLDDRRAADVENFTCAECEERSDED